MFNLKRLNVRSRNTGYYRNVGLLILRVGLGIMFILHGYPKVFGGPEEWKEIGQVMQYFGIETAPMFFGFMAGIAEFFGGIFLLLGLYFTPSLILLITVMFVAAVSHIQGGDNFSQISHAIELGIVFFSLLFIGPGKLSLDNRLNKRRRRRRY